MSAQHKRRGRTARLNRKVRADDNARKKAKFFAEAEAMGLEAHWTRAVWDSLTRNRAVYLALKAAGD